MRCGRHLVRWSRRQTYGQTGRLAGRQLGPTDICTVCDVAGSRGKHTCTQQKPAAMHVSLMPQHCMLNGGRVGCQHCWHCAGIRCCGCVAATQLQPGKGARTGMLQQIKPQAVKNSPVRQDLACICCTAHNFDSCSAAAHQHCCCFFEAVSWQQLPCRIRSSSPPCLSASEPSFQC